MRKSSLLRAAFAAAATTTAAIALAAPGTASAATIIEHALVYHDYHRLQQVQVITTAPTVGVSQLPALQLAEPVQVNTAPAQVVHLGQ
jgi:hypothetical protein